MYRSTTFAAAVMIAFAAAAAPAQAVGEAPPQGLFLTVTGGESPWLRWASLQCELQPTGTHPNAVAACWALEAARGDLNALAVDPRPCTKKYDPVRVTAVGTWHGRATTWHNTYGNECELHAATGAVFRF